MKILRYQTDRPAEQHSPSPALPGSPPLARALAAEAMNASELMYFFGAPLAHVVDYEDHIRANRHEKAVREMTRGRRALGFPPPLVSPAPLPDNTDAVGRP